MLLYLKVNNCFIYDKDIEFSMRANMHQKRFMSNLLPVDKTNVLKSSIIFGPNNSGKTNFVRILKTIKSIILNGKLKLGKNLFIDNNICSFEINFLDNQKEYCFEVKYDSFNKEYIYERFSEVSYDKYKNVKIKNLVIRDTENDFYCCDDDELLLSVMKVSARNNILIHLIDVNRFEKLKHIKDILISFASKIDVVDMNNIPVSKTIELLKKSDTNKQKIVDFILNADLFLEDFKYLNDEEVKIELSIPEENIKAQENVLNVSSSFMDMLHLASIYKGKMVPSILFDSTGTKKIAALASYVIDSLEKGRILIVDELDNSLHFRITRAIIALYNNELNNSAQLISTVHDISLLDCQRLFRKDQIWFTHKDKEDVYLYPLTEFTSEKDGIRDTSALIEKYKQGVFGALPEPNLLNILLEKGDDND